MSSQTHFTGFVMRFFVFQCVCEGKSEDRKITRNVWKSRFLNAVSSRSFLPDCTKASTVEIWALKLFLRCLKLDFRLFQVIFHTKRMHDQFAIENHLGSLEKIIFACGLRPKFSPWQAHLVCKFELPNTVFEVSDVDSRLFWDLVVLLFASYNAFGSWKWLSGSAHWIWTLISGAKPDFSTHYRFPPVNRILHAFWTSVKYMMHILAQPVLWGVISQQYKPKSIFLLEISEKSKKQFSSAPVN